MRETARMPQPPTNPPAWRQSSQQGLAKNDQKYNFWAKFCRFRAKNHNYYWKSKSFGTHITKKTPRHRACIFFLVAHGTKWAKNTNTWPKMAKNAYFGPNLALFGQRS